MKRVRFQKNLTLFVFCFTGSAGAQSRQELQREFERLVAYIFAFSRPYPYLRSATFRRKATKREMTAMAVKMHIGSV